MGPTNFIKIMIFSALLSLPCSVFSDQQEKYDYWKVSLENQFSWVVYETPGTYVAGHSFSIVNKFSECSSNNLMLKLSTNKPTVLIETYKDSTFQIEFQTKQDRFNVDLPLLVYKKISPVSEISVLVFTNFIINDNFLNLLNNNNYITVKIYDNESGLDIKEEKFNLKGFNEARLKAKKMCISHAKNKLKMAKLNNPRVGY